MAVDKWQHPCEDWFSRNLIVAVPVSWKKKNMCNANAAYTFLMTENEFIDPANVSFLIFQIISFLDKNNGLNWEPNEET